MERRIFFLRVTLADAKVWRRIAVPGAFTLDRLHRAIQLSMGWQDCHLHSFEVNAVQFGVPDPDGLMELRDELEARLDAVATKDTRFTYVYDFGDWWEHEILVEDVLVADPDERYPTCLDGAGDCPPEDVGGAYGYERFLDAIANPTHPDHDATLQWYGNRAHGLDFDADRATALLRRMA